jgi:hypothetical protein
MVAGTSKSAITLTGILLAQVTAGAYRLNDPNYPDVNFLTGQFAFGNAAYKADTSKPLFPGMDPLVLDLTGGGINLIGESDVSPVFDMNGDGYAVHTGWVQSNDGFLVLDNGSGQVTSIDQLFGGPGMSGFAALTQYDTNGDGVIDAADPIFSQLRIWVDANGNGVVDPGELETLTQAGIVSINLDATTQTGDTVAGNQILATATFTMADGSTRTIADVSFVTDNMHSHFTGDTTVGAGAAALPDLKGYGTLTDLQVAMSLDPSLVATMSADLPGLDVVDLTALRAAATPILSAWAAASPLSVTTLAPGGHSDMPIFVASNGSGTTVTDFAYEVTDAAGSYWKLASGDTVLDANGAIIARPTFDQVLAQTSSTGQWVDLTGAQLDFIERYFGEPITIDGNPNDPSQSLSVLGPVLNAGFTALNLEAVRLAMQGPLASYFRGISYNVSTDSFTPTTAQQLTPMYQAIFGFDFEFSRNEFNIVGVLIQKSREPLCRHLH